MQGLAEPFTEADVLDGSDEFLQMRGADHLESEKRGSSTSTIMPFPASMTLAVRPCLGPRQLEVGALHGGEGSSSAHPAA